MATNGPTIKLQSNEGDIFEVGIALIEQSELLKDFSQNSEECIIPLKNINSTILKKIIEWMDYHKNDILQSEEDDDNNRELSTTEISEWDREFLNIDYDLLFEIILAANYLNMKSLLDLTCRRVADMIKGKAPEEIRRTFGIRSNHTPVEEAKTEQENE